MARIGVYGGSFNPPHLGHIFAARKAQQLLGLDKVLLIPAAIPPHKAVAEGSPDGETRLALTKLAIAGEAGMEVSRIELIVPARVTLWIRCARFGNAIRRMRCIYSWEPICSCPFSNGVIRSTSQDWPCRSAWPASAQTKRFPRSCWRNRQQWRLRSVSDPLFYRMIVWKSRQPRPEGFCFLASRMSPAPGCALHDRAGESLRRGRQVSCAAI